mgnify:CR=1 FL=1
MRATLAAAVLFILCIADTAGAQNNLPPDGPRFGEVMLDWPLFGLQTNKDDFGGGLFLGIGGHINLIPIGDHDGLGIGMAFTLTGEKRFNLDGTYDWLGRTALAVTMPFTVMIFDDLGLTVMPLYELRRFDWTPGNLDTESRSFGLAMNFSYRLGHN